MNNNQHDPSWVRLLDAASSGVDLCNVGSALLRTLGDVFGWLLSALLEGLCGF
jgi:hypothetical protein